MKEQRQASRFLWFGMGLAVGVFLSRRLLNSPPGIPKRIAHLKGWENALSSRYGSQRAALLAAKVQSQYENLFSGRPLFQNPALRYHLETHILPGIALYQVLLDHTADQTTALDDLQSCFTAQMQAPGIHRPIRVLLDHLPGAFAVLRVANRVVLPLGFPKQGWQLEWVEDSPKRLAYHMTGCFYQDILKAYGVPELTAHFCALDDMSFGDLKHISWERTETLGRGDPHCNFVFRPRSINP